MSRSWKPSRDLLHQARELNQRREFRVLGPPARPKMIDALSKRRGSSVASIDPEADDAMRVLAEMFSDPKLRGGSYRRFVFDPEREEFIRDPIDC